MHKYTHYTYEAFKQWIESHGVRAKDEMGLRSGLGFNKVGRILRKEQTPTETEQVAIVSVLNGTDPLALSQKGSQEAS